MKASPLPPQTTSRTRPSSWLGWLLGAVACLVCLSSLAACGTRSAAEVRGEDGASPGSGLIAVRTDGEFPSPTGPMGEGASCHRKLWVQLPSALSNHGLEVTDPEGVKGIIRHAIKSICRQGPASTTVKRGAVRVLNCMGVLSDGIELRGIEETGKY